jgi:hypothetical protein
MKKGTKVWWKLSENSRSGNGVVLSDEDDGHVFVAVNSLSGETMQYHPVIHCAVTWLTTTAPEVKAFPHGVVLDNPIPGIEPAKA